MRRLQSNDSLAYIYKEIDPHRPLYRRVIMVVAHAKSVPISDEAGSLHEPSHRHILSLSLHIINNKRVMHPPQFQQRVLRNGRNQTVRSEQADCSAEL